MLSQKAVDEGTTLAKSGSELGMDSSASIFKSIQDSAMQQMKFTAEQGVLQNRTKMVESGAKQPKAIGEGIKNVGA